MSASPPMNGHADRSVSVLLAVPPDELRCPIILAAAFRGGPRPRRSARAPGVASHRPDRGWPSPRKRGPTLRRLLWLFLLGSAVPPLRGPWPFRPFPVLPCRLCLVFDPRLGGRHLWTSPLIPLIVFLVGRHRARGPCRMLLSDFSM